MAVNPSHNIHKEIGPKSEERYIFSWNNNSVEVCMISDIGNRRTNNEDRCLFSWSENPEQTKQLGILTAVADGMGGAAAGEHASEIAVNCLSDTYFNSNLANIPETLVQSVNVANQTIFDLSENNPTYFGMGTTVSVLVLHGDIAYVAQVGDSRIYLYRPEYPIKQITEDHSIVAEQLKEGLITEEEARNHSLKNLITRALGIKENVDIDLFAFRVKVGDTILLCSDGLSNFISERQLQKELEKDNLLTGITALVEKAIKEGGTDNITAIGIRIMGALDSNEFSNYRNMVIISPEGKPSLWKKIIHLFKAQK
ncbi:MAG: Stp1/IreP family PP2C-type Ser/Thr phosphatase [Candidatus Hydrogenedens sp.]|nr:Stp1/IreP family PP2C-type Ser/Thr phosphatase [Candidatus Hydrogenedens sp.]